MEGAGNVMLAAVTSAMSTVLDWVGTVIDALLTTDGALAELLPLFAIGISISAVMLGGLVAEGKSGKIGESCDANTEVMQGIA